MNDYIDTVDIEGTQYDIQDTATKTQAEENTHDIQELAGEIPNVVDVVQQDNTNAVSSNAVARTIKGLVVSIPINGTTDGAGNLQVNVAYRPATGYYPLNFVPTNASSNYPVVAVVDANGTVYLRPLGYWNQFISLGNLNLQGTLYMLKEI